MLFVWFGAGGLRIFLLKNTWIVLKLVFYDENPFGKALSALEEITRGPPFSDINQLLCYINQLFWDINQLSSLLINLQVISTSERNISTEPSILSSFQCQIHGKRPFAFCRITDTQYINQLPQSPHTFQFK
ncbi:hypothetical protein D1970_07195 [Mesobacillus zeae]|uniref:Uncharacterized protein n=1 Tax=Mesobacillus zeae TaxID=1917180 RepID=A0A398BFG6_9BACI|nr:hypothetical protein D1970_07195 [Mesobacillus zeae]